LPCSGSVYSVAFSPDGQVVATGDDAGDLELWSITDVELLAHYDEETGLGAGDGDVRSTANSTDGKFMYYGRGGQRRGCDKPEDPRNEPECRKPYGDKMEAKAQLAQVRKELSERCRVGSLSFQALASTLSAERATAAIRFLGAGAVDPDDLVGQAGFGAPRWVSAVVPLSYRVQFKNKPDATAPAAEVLITTRLDPTTIDATSVELGDINFLDKTLTPAPERNPPGLRKSSTER